MPRGGARPGAGRKPKAQADKKVPPRTAVGHSETGVKAETAPAGWPFGTEPPSQDQQDPLEPRPDLSGLMPLEYLLEVMRDPEEKRAIRMQAATLAAPYVHAKKGESGKKETKQEAAKTAAKRFTSAAPPKLVAAGGKKV